MSNINRSNFEQLVSVTEYAMMIGKSRQYVLKLLHQDKLPGAYKIGKQWVINVSDPDCLNYRANPTPP